MDIAIAELFKNVLKQSKIILNIFIMSLSIS